MTILLDASTPAFAHASNPSGAAAPTTASFSPPANSLLVALCGFDFGGTFSSMAVTDSQGSHLDPEDSEAHHQHARRCRDLHLSADFSARIDHGHHDAERQHHRL